MTPLKKYACLIVDDEPIARKIIHNYLDQMPNLICAGECKNAFEAIEYINSDESIEIVFLDINMPNINGITMVKILTRKVQIIFTTAYSEYAVESYELNAADYLLKPFLFDRFAKAVYKAIERLRDFSTGANVTELLPLEQPLFIKSNGQFFPVLPKNILYCEAMKNYTKIVTINHKVFMPLTSISKFEEELSALSTDFLRIHRSFIVSKKHIEAIGANYVTISNHKIPIGEQYKIAFFSQMGME